MIQDPLSFVMDRFRRGARFLVLVSAAIFAGTAAQAQIPAFAAASHLPPAKGERIAVFAGGCFWGVDAVFKHVKGVSRVVSGYSGGGARTAEYETVSTGTTGHAESVQITYDPAQISYSDLLRVFFSVAHDPTQLNRQGPDVGSQYRSAIFYANEAERATAQAYIDQLNEAGVFSGPIVTQVVPLDHFYAAEEYHQNYLARHPYQPYIVFNDAPKLTRLRQQFPALYKP
jgi:peptide-methionine (S)-S-oxide reductase